MIWTFPARLVRVIDGDTVVLDLDLGFYQWRLGRSYRLARIDAPELNTELGKVARAAVDAFLVGESLLVKSLLAQTSKADNFGRFIVELLADGENVSDWLVANGHAIYRTFS